MRTLAVMLVLMNTGVVESRYKALGGSIEAIIKPGGDHHPHSLPDPTPIVNFVIRSANATDRHGDANSAGKHD